MSNQPTPPTFRVLVFELWDNGKIICPGYPIIPPEQTVTLTELQQIKAHIDLMIANPQNFHIVRPESDFIIAGRQGGKSTNLITQDHINDPDGNVYPKSMREKLINGNWNPLCNKCDVVLISDTEKGTGICFDCEKKQLLSRVANPVVCKICLLSECELKDTICDCEAVDKRLKKEAKKNGVIRGHNETHEAYVCQHCGNNFESASAAINHDCKTIS